MSMQARGSAVVHGVRHRFAVARGAPPCPQVINDQDLIARGGKFWRIYKRPGQRVLIDRSGTMLARTPSRPEGPPLTALLVM